MKKLSKNELKKVNGGGYSAAFINSVARVGSLVLELGRSFGSSIRRIMTNTVC